MLWVKIVVPRSVAGKLGIQSTIYAHIQSKLNLMAFIAIAIKTLSLAFYIIWLTTLVSLSPH